MHMRLVTSWVREGYVGVGGAEDALEGLDLPAGEVAGELLAEHGASRDDLDGGGVEERVGAWQVPKWPSCYSLLLYSTHPLAALVMMKIFSPRCRECSSSRCDDSSSFSSSALVSAPMSRNWKELR